MEAKINAFGSYLNDVKKMSKNTQESYKRDLNKMRIFLENEGVTGVEEITRARIDSYIQYLENNHFAATTVSRTMAAIKTWFHFLKEQYGIDEEPVKRLKPPKISKKLPEILSVEDTRKLLSQPTGNRPKDLRDKAMLLVLYETGMRASQLISLQITDVDFDKNIIICRDETRTREIAVEEHVIKMIREYLLLARGSMVEKTKSESLFVNCSGKDMSRQGLWKILKGYAKKAGIEMDITPHTLRHSFAVHCFQKGMCMKDIQQLLGNADISSMQVYIDICKKCD